MSEPPRRIVASIVVALLVVAVWAFIESRAQAPAPPTGKLFPWELVRK